MGQPRYADAAQKPLAQSPPATLLYFQKPANGIAPAALPTDSPPSSRTFLPVAAAQKQDDKKQPTLPTEPTAEQISKYTKLESRERIFSMPNDSTLEKYVRQKTLEDNPDIKEKDLIHFPIIPDVGEGKPYIAKTMNYPPMQATFSPMYVVHRRLHFEDRNTERYGWDLGIIQPFVSAMAFYKDCLLWPQSLASGCAYGFWDTNAGKCLPGSPTPYLLYPPELTISGGLVEAAIITGFSYIIP